MLEQKKGLARLLHYTKKVGSTITAIGEGFYIVYRHGLYKEPNNPNNTQYVQSYCRHLCKVFNVEVKVHGETAQNTPALWVSNHVSWLDIPVLGAGARIFFLAKAEIASWPLLGKLAKGGGTLFIKRGSGDSNRVREQITEFLKKDVPVLFFPEATTTDGTYIKRIHGRLLGAAIEAQKPVQIALLCYVNQEGQLDNITPYVGDLSLAQHIFKVLEMPKVTVHMMCLPQIQVQGHTLESLTTQVQNEMTQGLKDLHAKVLHHTL